MNTAEINSKLQIVNIKGKRFRCPEGYYKIAKGYAFHVPELGYLAWKDTPFYPYSPSKKALQEILDKGGLVNFSLNVWVKELID